MAHHHHHRSRKFARNTRQISITSILIILSIIVFFSGLAYYYISNDDQQQQHTTIRQEENDEFVDDDDNDDDLVVNKTENVVSSGHELKVYEKEFKNSLRNVGQSMQDDDSFDDNVDDEYDDVDEIDNENGGDAIDSQDMLRTEMENKIDKGNNNAEVSDKVSVTNVVTNQSSVVSVDVKPVKTRSKRGNISRKRPAKKLGSEKGLDRGRPVKVHNKGSSCEMKFMNSTAQLVEPPESTKFSSFTLQYTDVEERPSESKQWHPRFSGHQSLEEREESFYARDQRINCGFIKGPEGSQSTGFDLEEADFRYMSRCHIAVSSCIFGNSDYLRSPFGKTVTRLSRKNVCFVMFVDEITSQTLAAEDHKPDEMGFIGLWKIVVVKNLPFDDLRRVGKIPKFLAHRLFPSARYSIWLDSKLRLQSDPILILEYFLWRKGYEYAISNHYRRHCVWEEVVQNKKLNKFNHTILDEQFFFYQADGLQRFNASDPNKLLPSNVPEGSFILRAHTPMSNLFSCLWFNEVDRFTPRDQLSFAYVYHKLRGMNPDKPFYFNMFKDCERRTIAKLFRHRSEETQKVPADLFLG